MGVRVQFLLLVAVVSTFSFLCVHYLPQLGVASLVHRHVIATCLSYALFFLLVRVWLSLHHEMDGLASVMVEQPTEEKKKEDNTAYWATFLDVFTLTEILGVIGTIIAACAFSYLVLSWIFIEGPLILANTAVEYSVFAGLLALKNKKGEVWYEHLFKHTWVPFLIVLVIGTVVSVLIQTPDPM